MVCHTNDWGSVIGEHARPHRKASQPTHTNPRESTRLPDDGLHMHDLYERSRPGTELLQFGVFGLGLLQDGNVGFAVGAAASITETANQEHKFPGCRRRATPEENHLDLVRTTSRNRQSSVVFLSD